MYNRWLSYVFDREVTDPAWYFALDEPDFEASDEEIVALIHETLNNCGSGLAKYSEAQIDQGLNYIFNNSCSDVVFSFKNSNVDVELRKEALTSIKKLYTDCLCVRVAPVLAHLDAPGANPLNSFCYMFWDITPLSWWEDSDEKDIFEPVVLDVLEFVLGSGNVACIESALHGLGHVHNNRTKTRINTIISAFIDERSDIGSEIIHYANTAKLGCVL
jgi:hypothetical protein